MTTSGRWIKRPAFLLLPPEEWPKKPLSYTSDDTCDQHSTFAAWSSTIDQHTFEETINKQRFSKWDRLLRALSYCYWLADIIRNPNVNRTLKLRYLTKAFSYIRTSQRQFGDITALQKTNEPSTKSRSRSLQHFIDNWGVLRARGQLSKAPYLLTSKNPFILDAEDWTINLQIKHIQMATDTVDWSIQDQHFKSTTGFFDQVVRSIISKCKTCRRLRQDIRQPLMGDLPRDRLPKNISPVRDNRSWLSWTFSRKEPTKPWKTLHTAFHMSLNSCSAHESYRNFVNRTYTFSGTTTHQSPRTTGNNPIKQRYELHWSKQYLESWIWETAKQSLFCKTVLNKGITWVFNPPSAPHFGGAWERLIRVFKDTFFKIAGKRQLTPPTMETLTIEIENIMNNRPLT